MSVFLDPLRQKSQFLLCRLEATAQNEIYFEMKNKLLSGQKFIVFSKSCSVYYWNTKQLVPSGSHILNSGFEKQTTTLWHYEKQILFPNILYV